jgi:lysine 2,3-aminomutase
MPNYLVSASDDAVVLRNYEGMLVRYQAEDKPQTARPTATRGVSSLLQGTKSALIPAGSERMARRELHVLTNGNGQAGGHNGHAEHPGPHAANGNGHANGCCNGHGHANGKPHGEDLLNFGAYTNGCGT